MMLDSIIAMLFIFIIAKLGDKDGVMDLLTCFVFALIPNVVFRILVVLPDYLSINADIQNALAVFSYLFYFMFPYIMLSKMTEYSLLRKATLSGLCTIVMLSTLIYQHLGYSV